MTGFITKKLSSRTRSLGAILKAARTKAQVTIEEAEKRTKICAKYLVALEAGNYAALPAEAYNIGFVRGYAQFLKLNPDKIVRLYREERSNQRLSSHHPDLLLQPRRMSDWRFLITPRLIAIVSGVIIFGAMISYIFGQLRAFASPPPLELSTPADFTSTQDTVTVKGHTATGSLVTMNAQPINVADDGTFSEPIQLAPGLNHILVQARSRSDKVTQVPLNILYDKGVAQLPQSAIKE
jgi:cytoskeletal protein RodZ